jgi:acetyl-CoA carboxylase biotin carboxyl carrier protein
LLKVSDIRELIRLLDETSVHELSIETDEITVTMKKADANYSGATTTVHTSPQVSATAATQVAAPVNHSEVVVSSAATEQLPIKEETGFGYIKSPMVGTFYRASSPTVPPYVEIGTKVTPKSVVCIVEAMKLMNEIEADVQGEIVEVLAENGHLVEYGQPLFKVKTA